MCEMKRYFLVFFIFFNCVSFSQSSPVKRNVLLIIIDDLRHLSSENVTFFNFKKLFAKSLTFDKAFAQQSLCAPSRNSILTGRRPDSLHLYDFYSYWRHTVSNFTTLPQYLKEHGYNTYSVGKVFHPGPSSNFTDDYPYSWTHKPYHPPTEKYKDDKVCLDKQTGKYQSNLICPITVKSQPGKSLPDLQSLDYAVNILKTNKNHNSKPFFLAVGFHKPHIPLKFPRKYLAKVPMNKIQPPRNPDMPENMPLVSWHPWTDVRNRDDIARLNISFPYGTMPALWTKKVKRAYYAATMYVDDLIGRLMKHVDMDNTVVALTSDHGWSLGENGLWAKYSNFDVALRVPLYLYIPGTAPKTIDTPVELIDIFPTLLDVLEFPKTIPKCKHRDKNVLCFEGKSLVPSINSKNTNNFAISQYPRPSVYTKKNSDKPRLKSIKIMGYSIRTKRYRYTEWISFNSTAFTRNWNKVYGYELYDHDIDPDEAVNYCFNPKYDEIIFSLSKLLRSNVELLNQK